MTVFFTEVIPDIYQERNTAMNDDIVRGSGNVFRDLGHPNPDREQLRALLAAEIIGVLDDRKLTVRAAGTVRRRGGGFFTHPAGQSRPFYD
jgi:hypothetical protein